MWRSLMSRARGRSRCLPSSSPSSSVASSTFSNLSLLAHDGRFVSVSKRIWPGLGLGFAQTNEQKNVEALLQDAKDFLLDSSLKEGNGRLDVGLLEGLHFFDQKKSPRAWPAEFAAETLTFKKAWLDAGLSVEKNAPKHAEDVSLQLSMSNKAMQAPGVCGSEDSVIYADSVKRKRKKKMNKHKHRKLRRLARKSHK